ncbi:unnamed protein product [Dovyalis caffra]|uniref:Uncharacterized protein n=1 Tax=Dovyalis caffra TaxID=77055 RepID=A0AAV1QZY4_9ROSI|nr:unnamed protein product [Dovyalis caffra]
MLWWKAGTVAYQKDTRPIKHDIRDVGSLLTSRSTNQIKHEKNGDRETDQVKVRADGQDDQHAYDWSSLLSLKDIQSLCLQDSCFPGKGHQDVSPTTIARIPKSYVPNVIMPKVSVSEGTEKKNNFTEDRPNIRASLIPRPRAVLSSPDNDAVIGNNNRTKVARPTASKNNKLIQSRHELCKVVPSQMTDASPTNTRKSKSTPDNKSELKVKKGSPTEASNQRRKTATDKPHFMRI